MPKVTAMVVSYNHERFISECLASIEQQNFDDLEVICVDDGSSDASPKIAHEFDAMDVMVYKKPNGGPSDAFNYGIERASGDILMMISADDTMLPGSIAARVNALEDPDVDIVCGLPTWIGADSRDLPPSDYPDIFLPFELSPEAMFKRLFFEGNFISAPTIAMRRAIHHEIGPFDQRFEQLQDYDYWLRAAALGKKFICIDRPLVGYRWHGGNLSTSNSERSEAELSEVRKAALQHADQIFLSKVLYESEEMCLQAGLSHEEIASLLMIKHRSQILSNLGRLQLQKLLENNERKEVLRNEFLI